MNFDFSGAVKAKESGSRFTAGIKNATFQGVEFATVTSQSSGDTFKTLALKLDIEGTPYTQNFFEPTSNERKPNPWGGESASQLDHFLIIVREILEAVDPQIIKDIDEGYKTLSGNFKQVCDTIKSWTISFIGKEVQVKMIPNKGYVQIPSYPARITKSGDLGIATRIIGSNLTLTTAEQNKIDAAANATPTNMSAKTSVVDTLADMASDESLNDLPEF